MRFLSSRIKTILSVNLAVCLRELSSNRARSIITSLGIFLGVASLLINLAFIRAMDDDLKDNMERIGGLDIITVNTIEAITPKEKLLFKNSGGLTPQDARYCVKEIPEVKNYIEYKSLRWSRVSSEGGQSWAKILAVTPSYLSAYNYKLGDGRIFNENDFLQKRQVCIIGTRLSGRLFGKGVNPIGKIITVHKHPLEIVGTIYSESVQNNRAMEILFPYPLYTAKFGVPRYLNSINLQLTHSRHSTKVITSIRNVIKGRHRGVEDFAVEANTDKISEMKAASVGMKVLLWTIASISLIVGGISIMNIMFATIGNRIKEIGIRKALGAQRRDIFLQFIVESIIVCFLGGIPGIILGSSFTLIPAGIFPFDPRLASIDYGVAVGFIIFAGFCAGLFPALEAASMEPVDALRY